MKRSLVFSKMLDGKEKEEHFKNTVTHVLSTQKKQII